MEWGVDIRRCEKVSERKCLRRSGGLILGDVRK